MIVVDTSALMAIVMKEQEAEACIAALRDEPRLVSAATITEALIVGMGRNVDAEMSRLIDALAFEVISVTPLSARGAAEAYAKWGKGRHPAGLNFGDCFAYQLAADRDLPLLYIGQDFARTDVRSAL